MFNVKVTINGKYEIIKAHEAESALIAVQEVTEMFKNGAGMGNCDLRVEITDEVPAISIETRDDLSGFRFRVTRNGESTPWCTYNCVAFVAGHVVSTSYHHCEAFHLTPIPVELYMLATAICQHSETSQIFDMGRQIGVDDLSETDEDGEQEIADGDYRLL